MTRKQMTENGTDFSKLGTHIIQIVSNNAQTQKYL